MGKNIGFTKRAFESLIPAQKRYRITDSNSRESVHGLVLEIMPSGSKYFRFRRFQQGKYITVSIGEFPNITIEQARHKAKEISFNFAEGLNPNQIKQEAKQKRDQEEALTLTIAELFQVYVEEFKIKIKTGERRQKSLDDINSMWRNHVAPKLGKLRSETLSQDDTKKFMMLLVTKASTSVHNKCLTILKAIFRDQPFNPFSKIKKYACAKRERILSEEEVRALLNALKQERQIYSDVVMTLLLTGQRKNCVFSMEWAEVDYQNQVWLIPTSKMKAKKPHAVPLTSEVISILERRSAQAVPGERYVFPAINSHEKHIVEKSGKGSFWHRITQTANLRGEKRGENVTIHDLRRTIASWSVMRGGSIQITSKLLGHSDISITASTYAHLDVESVREELSLTTARLLGAVHNESKVDRLLKDITKLSHEEKVNLHQAVGLML